MYYKRYTKLKKHNKNDNFGEKQLKLFPKLANFHINLPLIYIKIAKLGKKVNNWGKLYKNIKKEFFLPIE